MSPGSGVVVVGAGQAAIQLTESLREAGFTGPVSVVGDEPQLPYQRPPLSKEYLAGKVTADELALRGSRFYTDRNVELHLGRRAVRLDRDRRRLTLDDGTTLPYDHLVLATGARPRPLPVPGGDLDGVLNLRTLADAREIRSRLPDARDVVVIGAGFIGLEFAAVCRAAGLSPVVLDVAGQVMGRAVSAPVAAHFAERHQRDGTRLLLGRAPAELVGGGGRVTGVRLTDGQVLPADTVVTGIGVVPNVELAEAAGLDTGNGITVDEYLRTADPAISAIGDCAAFPDPRGTGRVRLESVQNAADQARCVAAGLTGTPHPYNALPWFWSYQGDLRLQIAGLSTGHDHTVVRGEPERGFSVLCFRAGSLIAVESVNRAPDHMAARRLLAAGIRVTPDDVAAPGFSLRSPLARTAETADRKAPA
ncbi:NAD(P)/FAD-dependent oxidoreductase [Streptomyces sp. CA-249302]|uniref:NAD(P)/FAD-dependent oxidoreductase n=1 Tax=Streptomyces sp. CA-249302 TaxID=3240058 RepID=UPI003D8D2F05